MATQLHEAVQLAQAGNRDDARRLLRQVVQSDPNNEVAWLWLASVAADLAEYERALTEVLRVNPANQQARQLLGQFRDQYGSQIGASPAAAPAASPPYAVPPQPTPQTPPPQSQTPPPYYPPPQAQAPSGYGYPQAQPGAAYEPVYPAPQEPARSGGGRGCAVPAGCAAPGCGCGGGCMRGCILVLVLLIVLPAIACGALSLSSFSLGPFDLPAAYLPDRFGRKEVAFTLNDQDAQSGDTTRYNVAVTVPRSWFPALESDISWTFLREALDELVPWEEANASWDELTVDLDTAGPETRVPIVETNYFLLTGSGGLIGMFYEGTAPGDYACRAMQNAMPAGAQLVERGALCGYALTTTETPEAGSVFQDVDAPNRVQTTTLVTPIADNLGARWTITLPEDLVPDFDDDIAAIIDTAEVTLR